MRKRKDPDLWQIYPDPGGRKPCGSCGSGSVSGPPTLMEKNGNSWQTNIYDTIFKSIRFLAILVRYEFQSLKNTVYYVILFCYKNVARMSQWATRIRFTIWLLASWLYLQKILNTLVPFSTTRMLIDSRITMITSNKSVKSATMLIVFEPGDGWIKMQDTFIKYVSAFLCCSLCVWLRSWKTVQTEFLSSKFKYRYGSKKKCEIWRWYRIYWKVF
jgi:hypothetical protein